MTIARRIREANKRVFDAKDFDEYERNPSIFEPARQDAIRARIREAAVRGRTRMLDIGCGTGNILRLAASEFDTCCGVDVAPRMVAELKRRRSEFRLAAADAEHLPFAAGTFDLVTMYGVLHHLWRVEGALREAARVLRTGGSLYVDHDPNYYFGRFFRVFYRLRHLTRPGFGDEETEMSEWHNSRTGGLDPEALRRYLGRIGFARIEVEYRLTTNPHLEPLYRVVRAGMRAALKVVRWRSLYTHFAIVAVRA